MFMKASLRKAGADLGKEDDIAHLLSRALIEASTGGINMSWNKGFSLIEAMIAVAIMAILASIAYPIYTQYVIRSNRAAAQSFMMDIAAQQERYLLDKRSYVAVNGLADWASLRMSIPSEVGTNYGIKVETTKTPLTYTITATPNPGSLQAHDGDLMLRSNGQKEPKDKWK
jgi:type IV pilus assembly protein PilE